MTSPTLRPVPAYAPIVVCVLCGAREIGRDGLWMESGCAYCDACVTRRRREMDAMFGKKRVTRQADSDTQGAVP